MAKYYIGKYHRSGSISTQYYATDTSVIEENTPYEPVSYYDGAWHGSFEEIGDNGLYFTNVSITGSNLEHMGQVDYNKHSLDVDLIVDYAQARAGSYYHQGCKIVEAADDIQITTDYENNNGEGEYWFANTSSIGLNGDKDTMKVRILNFGPEPIDLDVQVNRSSYSTHGNGTCPELNGSYFDLDIHETSGQDYTGYIIISEEG